MGHRFLDLVKQKELAYSQTKVSFRTQNVLEEYKTLKNRVPSTRRQLLRKEYFQNKLSSNSPKNVWEVANKALNRKKKNLQKDKIEKLCHDGMVTQNYDEICEIFNDFYVNNVEKLTEELENKEYVCDNQLQQKTIYFFPTDEEEVLKEISSLPNKSNKTEDGINNKLMKQCKNELAPEF